MVLRILMDSITSNYYRQERLEMLEFIPKTAHKILDVGCGEGMFGLQLKDKFNAEVWGVEVDAETAAAAKGKIDKVLIGDISQVIDDMPAAYFDCIVFNDVLEHLIAPEEILAKIKNKIGENGVVVCSIPNVRNFNTLRDLIIKKQWDYKGSGVLDRTHLRFFTYNSIVAMFDSTGYEILNIKGISAIKSWKFDLFNFMLLGYLSDTKHQQFACVAKPKNNA